MTELTPSSIPAIVAIYAAMAATCSLIIAIKAYLAGGPIVKASWEYLEETRDLSIKVKNTGRADVTISSIDVFIVYKAYIANHPGGKHSLLIENEVAQIPGSRCSAERQEISMIGLISNSSFTVHINGDISSTDIGPVFARYPLERQNYIDGKFVLRCVVRTPQKDKEAEFCDEDLYHFVARSDELTRLASAALKRRNPHPMPKWLDKLMAVGQPSQPPLD